MTLASTWEAALCLWNPPTRGVNHSLSPPIAGIMYPSASTHKCRYVWVYLGAWVSALLWHLCDEVPELLLGESSHRCCCDVALSA